MSATSVQVAHHVTEVVLGGHDLDGHHRLEQRLGLACCIAALKAIEPATLNAISLESTSWNDPSTSKTRTSTTG